MRLRVKRVVVLDEMNRLRSNTVVCKLLLEDSEGRQRSLPSSIEEAGRFVGDEVVRKGIMGRVFLFGR